MKTLHRRCAGLDVHSDSVVACARLTGCDQVVGFDAVLLDARQSARTNSFAQVTMPINARQVLVTD